MVTTIRPAATKYVVVNARTSAPIAARLEVLRATGRRLFRLLGQRTLRGGEGIRYLLDGDPLHVQLRRAAVDVAFLDRDGTVLHALHSLPSFQPGEVHSVIELPAGTLDRLETRPGDVLAMYRTEEA